MDVIDNKKKVIAAYKNSDFELQTFENNSTTYAYYPHANYKCYDCMVNMAQTYSIDDIIEGEIKVYNKNFIADFLAFPSPHKLIRKYIGISSNSQNIKNSNISQDAKTPNIAVSNMNINA